MLNSLDVRSQFVCVNIDIELKPRLEEMKQFLVEKKITFHTVVYFLFFAKEFLPITNFPDKILPELSFFTSGWNCLWNKLRRKLHKHYISYLLYQPQPCYPILFHFQADSKCCHDINKSEMFNFFLQNEGAVCTWKPHE